MKYLEVQKQGHVQKVLLSRPEVHNAFHPDLISELTALFEAIKSDDQIRVVTLGGQGKSFCAGADLRWMQSMVNFTLEQNLADSYKLFDMFWHLATCPVPVIAKVHGSVFGGALGLLGVSDIVAAEKGTRFCFSEVNLGLTPAVISPFVCQKVMAAKVREWMLTGRVFGADEALGAGLINFVGTDNEVSEYTEQIQTAVINAGPEAVRSTKALLWQVLGAEDLLKYKSDTARVIAERRVSIEGQEGLQAFFAKRAPSWRRD